MNPIKTNAKTSLQRGKSVLRALPGIKKRGWHKLAVADGDTIHFIAYDDILYCQSKNNYTTIVRRNGKAILCCKSLKQIESKLPMEDFVRIHGSYLVNMGAITALKRQAGQLEVDHQYLLPISKLKKKAVYCTLGVQ
jgi:DNA-binding LytR/AlgR family response regulator